MTEEPSARHPEIDDPIIASAVAAKADYLVTGDRAHLLPIGEYRGIRIISPRAFLEILG